MAKWFFAYAFAVGTDVMWCFGFAGTVIGDRATAAGPAVPWHDSNSDAAPTVGTIIATGNGATAVVGRKPGPG
jgi:hypothetical protein